MPEPKIINVECVCARCQLARRIVPGFNADGYTFDEQVIQVGKQLEPLGWATKQDADGRLGFVCPACLADEYKGAAKTPDLPQHGTHKRCPKCGYNSISQTYRYPQCYRIIEAAYVEHIEKECNRCRYVWAEKVKEPSPPIWEKRNVQ